MYLIAMLSEIYLYCHFGTELYEEVYLHNILIKLLVHCLLLQSITITDAIYMGNWYNYSIKSRKSLILLMERAKKPVVVTCGKILDLSLITFTMVQIFQRCVKRHFNYLFVLFRFYEDLIHC